MAIEGLNADKGCAIGDAFPVIKIARYCHFNLVYAGEVGRWRRYRAEGIEDGGKTDVNALVGKDSHIIDLGDIVDVVEEWWNDIGGVFDNVAYALAAVLAINLVAVEDQHGISEGGEILARREPDRTAPFGLLFHQS